MWESYQIPLDSESDALPLGKRQFSLATIFSLCNHLNSDHNMGRSLNLNGLLVTPQIDNTSPGGGGGGCAREISPWLSQEMRTWTHSHESESE